MRPILVAGEPERETRAARIAGGIPIDGTTWRDLIAAAETVGAGGGVFTRLE